MIVSTQIQDSTAIEQFSRLKRLTGVWRQGVLGGVQGAESLFLWRAIGAAVLTLVPAIAYSLKVCLRSQRHD